MGGNSGQGGWGQPNASGPWGQQPNQGGWGQPINYGGQPGQPVGGFGASGQVIIRPLSGAFLEDLDVFTKMVTTFFYLGSLL